MATTGRADLGRARGVPPSVCRTLALSLLAGALHPGAAVFGAASPGPGEEWRLVRAADDVRLYRRTVPGSAVPWLQARGIVAAPPRRMYEVVSDYGNFTDFVPYVALSRTVAHENATRRVHQRLHLPGPVADREYVLRISDSVEAAPEPRYRVQWRLDREATARQNPVGVVPAFFSGAWELRDGPEPGSTEATYTIHFDPGGAVPDWLARLGIRRMLPEVFAAVRRRAQGGAVEGWAEPQASPPLGEAVPSDHGVSFAQPALRGTHGTRFIVDRSQWIGWAEAKVKPTVQRQGSRPAVGHP